MSISQGEMPSQDTEWRALTDYERKTSQELADELLDVLNGHSVDISIMAICLVLAGVILSGQARYTGLMKSLGQTVQAALDFAEHGGTSQ